MSSYVPCESQLQNELVKKNRSSFLRRKNGVVIAAQMNFFLRQFTLDLDNRRTSHLVSVSKRFLFAVAIGLKIRCRFTFPHFLSRKLCLYSIGNCLTC